MNNDIKEEVYKCSKCGLCQSVCPIYLATKNEMYLSRGRYIVLNNFFNNKKILSKDFIENLDICLNCNLCKDFCPSNIDMSNIVLHLKNKYSRKLIPFYVYYKVLLFFKGILKYKSKYKLKNTGTKANIIYFEGCYNRYIDSADKNASLELIEKLGYKVNKIISDCCGYPILADANLNKFESNAKKIIDACSCGADYIVCSCDSCFETLSKIDNADFVAKLIRFDKLLEINGYNLPNANKSLYFKPILRKDDCYLPSEIITINKKGTCSLMENFFMLKHKNLAKRIEALCLNFKNEIEGKTLITSCNLSKWGLSKFLKFKVVSYAEYVKKEVD